MTTAPPALADDPPPGPLELRPDATFGGPWARRRVRPERMDDPGLDPAQHERALEALARVNRVSLSSVRVWREVARLHRDGVSPVRVLDVACGGGDVLVDVARRATRAGVPVELHGCDASSRALAHARRSMPPGVAAAFHEVDVLAEPLPAPYHLVCSSLFLHHLQDEAVVAVLRAMADATTDTLLVQDLRRTRLGYLFAWIGLHVLTTSRVARHDGLISVGAAFTAWEARASCRAAGLDRARVETAWPQRLVIRWRSA